MEYRGEAIALLEDTAFRRLSPHQLAHLGGRVRRGPAYLLRAFGFIDRPYTVLVSRRNRIVHTDGVTSVPGYDAKLRRTAVMYYDTRPIDHVYVSWGVSGPVDAKRPDHAMESTASRRYNLLFVISNPYPAANRALARGDSSWSR